MDWSPDRWLQARMVLTLALLGLTVVAATLATWAVTTAALAGVISVPLGDPLTTPEYLALGAVGTVVVAAVVVHGERDAPEYAVALTGATPADEAAHPTYVETVRALALQANVPVPELFVAPTETPLALTTGFRPTTARLVVSAGLLDALSERELRAVVAHELAHVANRDTAVLTAATLPTAAADRVYTLVWGSPSGADHGVVNRADYADGLVAMALLLAAPVWLAGRAATAALSRTREFSADRGAVAITGDPAGLASALGTIDDGLTRTTRDFRETTLAAFAIAEPAGTGRFGDLFATHPPMERRLERLRALARERAEEGR